MMEAAVRPKILLVDDEPFILSAVGGVLRSGGFDVLTCEMWAGVANMVRTENPDIVLLDYNMPSLKGDNICVILKRNIQDSAMKVILFSSEAEKELSQIAERCGADGYIKKNTPGPELLRMLDEMLRGDAVLG
jgi:DNA-binding response OmpR family regulator